MMKSERQYAESRRKLLIVINDMAELQRATLTLSDTPSGRIHYRTQMYGIDHDYHFYVRETEDGCIVELEMNDRNASRLIHQAYYLLESLMVGNPGNGDGKMC